MAAIVTFLFANPDQLLRFFSVALRNTPTGTLLNFFLLAEPHTRISEYRIESAADGEAVEMV